MGNKQKTQRVPKQLRSNAPVELDRTPKKLDRLGVLEDGHPTWRLSLVDLDGPWGWRSASHEELVSALALLMQAEKQTWQELSQQMTGGNRRRGQRNKYIPIEHCAASAQERLRELQLDDYGDSWFRFRIGNLGRLWGVMHGETFYPVWWDRSHTVCPSKDQ